MTSIADQYRRKGDEASLAEMDADDPFVCRMYAKIARHWHELAERAEREEGTAVHPARSAIPKADNPTSSIRVTWPQRS